MKRQQYLLILALVTICLMTQVVSAPYTLAQKKDNKELNEAIKKMEDKVSEIRRDQLNYKIERDLLKETFSSNFQTLNLVLAIILGVFTIINYLGFRDIGSIKKEYLSELSKLDGLRAAFEEKINSLIRSRNFTRALEFGHAALDLAPNNQLLLRQKAYCHLKLGDFSRAAKTYEQLLMVEPEDIVAITNLLETYLILNRIEEYKHLLNKAISLMRTKEDWPFLETYFKVLENYQSDNYREMLSVMKYYSETLPDGEKLKTKFVLDEIERFLKTAPNDKRRSLLEYFVKFITGAIETTEFKSEIAKRATSADM